MGNLKEQIPGYSAKIKNVFIELKDYHYFHGPSEPGNIDKRFIGREDIFLKLRNILTNNKTKSGAYLVTGYRGAGKSSFVNKVINDISSDYRTVNLKSRYFIIFLSLMFISMFNLDKITCPLVIYIPTLLLLMIYLVFSDFNRKDIKITTNKYLFIEIIARVFWIEDEHVPRRRLRAIVSDMFIIALIQIISYINFQIISDKEKINIFLFNILYLVIFIFLSQIRLNWIKHIIKPIRKSTKTSIIINKFKCIIKNIALSLQRHINYSHRIYLKINLGHENIKEIDVLRLIARNLLTKYERIAKSIIPKSFLEIIKKTIFLLLLIIITGNIYYLKPFCYYTDDIKLQSGLINYFPSQANFEYSREEIKEITNLLNSSKYNYKDHIALLKGKSNKYAKQLFEYKAGIKKHVQKITLFIDLNLNESYSKLKEGITKIARKIDFANIGIISLGNKINNQFGVFKILPNKLDYFYIAFLILSYWAINIITRKYRPFGMITHKYIYMKLKELNDLISSNVSKESINQFEATKNTIKISRGWKKTKQYPIADLKEIEKQLIEILNDIDNIPKILIRPDFYFIFDELDKIELRKNVSISEKEQEEQFKYEDSELIISEESKKRQYTVMNILANLKHFLTTARAKFIFIAGREIYDSSLADVSDRHFFIGSIFNDVIYINSFLSDTSDRKLSDITSMTEAYVCKWILPRKYIEKYGLSLKTYNIYLKENYFPENVDKIENKWKREKIIYLIYNFIIYLTYRSNGSPKKITRCFESFIEKPTRSRLEDSDINLTVGLSSRNMYLSFSYFDQYTFGLIAHIANPIFLSINKNMKDYGDKLLVSTAFIVDYIYKFHGFGFSWRNLELMPEIIDIHKAPELRDLINRLINVLLDEHLQEILSGLYDYRFSKKINEEISFLSKISEKESAAFNFTLDESLALKKYYHKKLNLLQKRYVIVTNKNNKEDYIHSIGFVHMILGDLYYYDKEIDSAIIEYLNAIQILRNIPRDQLNTSLFILIIRNMLKLGLSFEKKRSYDSAFSCYVNLASLVIGYRDVDLNSIGIKLKSKKDHLIINKASEYKVIQKTIKDIQDNNKEIVVSVVDNIPNYDEEAMYKSNQIENTKGILDFIYDHFTPKKDDILHKISIYEGIRLVYQPFLAKLQTIEKTTLGGISLSDLKSLEIEINYLKRTIRDEDNFIVQSDILNKIGDILYFKNCRLDDKYCEGEKALCAKSMLKMGEEELNKTPCTACKYYHKSLEKIISEYFKIQENPGKNGKYLIKIMDKMDKSKININNLSRNRIILMTVGNILSDLGNTYLSCAGNSDKLHDSFILKLIEIMNANKYCDKSRHLSMYFKDNNNQFNKIEETILCYYLSGLFYRYAGEKKEYAFQMKKILYVIRDAWKIIENTTIVNKLEKVFMTRLYRYIYDTYDGVHRLEIKKIKEIFESENEPSEKYRHVNLRNISISTEINEIVYIFLEIMIRAEMVDVNNRIKMGSAYNTISSMYNRIIELRFIAKINYQTLKKINIIDKLREIVRLDIEYKKNRNENNKEKIYNEANGLKQILKNKELFEFLLTDSVFCFHEIIKIINMFGISYMTNHSIIAEAHKKLGDWCYFYYIYTNYIVDDDKERKYRLKEILKKNLSEIDINEISYTYQYNKAINHFIKALETHNEGASYKEIIDKMYYLNDDFSDNLDHFCAASERYRINTIKIRNAINELRPLLDISDLYKNIQYAPWISDYNIQ